MTEAVSSQDRTRVRRTWLGPKIYVEDVPGEDAYIVSWPGGHHKVIAAAVFVQIGLAIEDTYHPPPKIYARLIPEPEPWQQPESSESGL